MVWQRLGETAPSLLSPARVQAHRAVQVVAAVGETFLPHVPDTSHSAMTWSAAHAALLGREIPGDTTLRVALRVADLALLLLDDRDAPLAEGPLEGRTLREAYAWTRAALETHSRGRLGRPLLPPGFELEAEPLDPDAPLRADDALPELARWYANAASALARFADETPDAGEVLCWPHHFDIASLVVLESDPTGEVLRSVGVGLSPGDGFIGEPYWYVNHGPETDRRELPLLAEGEWFRDGWTGAVLRSDRLVAAGDAGDQEARLRAFLASAVKASRALALETPLA